jgi:arylsulfatase A-like enzyme
MQRPLTLLGFSATFGLVVGIAVALARVQQEHYANLALNGLALSMLAQFATSAVFVAITASAGGQILWLVLDPVIDTVSALQDGSRRIAKLMLGLAVFLCSVWPVWIWLGAQLASLIPTSAAPSRGVEIGFLLVHIPLYFAARSWSRVPAPSSGMGLAAGALSIVCLATLLLFDKVGAFDSESGEHQPNVLIIVMDTVRADRLSSYGYERPTTPELDQFAEEAIRFSHFYSTSSWTVPSHASIFTGLYPIRHGAHQENPSLRPEFATMAEVLQNAGYQTFGASQNPYVRSNINLTQGFHEFDDLWRRWVKPDGRETHVDSITHPVNAAFDDFLAKSDRNRPFFVFFNYIDAHLPTAPPQPFLSRFQRHGTRPEEALRVGLEDWTLYYVGKETTQSDIRILSDLYDAELAYMSYSIGALLKSLREDGRYDDTLIIVTSDHGEHMGENGHLGHMMTLYNTAVRVPLLIKPAGGVEKGRVDDRPGQLVDLFPTVLEATETNFEAAELHGLNLLGSRATAKRDAIFSEYYYPAQVMKLFGAIGIREQEEVLLEPYRRRLRAIQINARRLIWSSTGDHELYNLEKDPGENDNLYSSHPELARELLARLEAAVEKYGGPHATSNSEASIPDFDEETQDALRALGYVR